MYTRVDGATGQTAADYRPFDRATDGFNYAPYNYSQTPNERGTLWLLGSQPLGERLNLFVEGLVHHRESTQEAHRKHISSGLRRYWPTARRAFRPRTTTTRSAWPCCRRTSDCRAVSSNSVIAASVRTSISGGCWLASKAGLPAGPGRFLLPSQSPTRRPSTLTLFRSRLVQALGPSGPDDAGPHCVRHAESPRPVAYRRPALSPAACPSTSSAGPAASRRTSSTTSAWVP